MRQQRGWEESSVYLEKCVVVQTVRLHTDYLPQQTLVVSTKPGMSPPRLGEMGCVNCLPFYLFSPPSQIRPAASVQKGAWSAMRRIARKPARPIAHLPLSSWMLFFLQNIQRRRRYTHLYFPLRPTPFSTAHAQ